MQAGDIHQCEVRWWWEEWGNFWAECGLGERWNEEGRGQVLWSKHIAESSPSPYHYNYMPHSCHSNISDIELRNTIGTVEVFPRGSEQKFTNPKTSPTAPHHGHKIQCVSYKHT